MKRALRILIYLRDTDEHKIWFEIIDDNIVDVFTDGSYKSIFDEGKSRSGYVSYLYGCIIDWSSSKQCKISKSPAECELIAVVENIVKIELMENVVNELVGRVETKVYVDLKSVLEARENDTNKSKMINRLSEIKQMKEFFKYRHALKICSEVNRADVFTKPMQPTRFEEMRFNLNIYTD